MSGDRPGACEDPEDTNTIIGTGPNVNAELTGPRPKP